LPLATTRKDLVQKLHWAIQKLSSDLPEFKYNTAIAALMELANLFEKLDQDEVTLFTRDELVDMIKLLAPLAPFIAEELYDQVRILSGEFKDSVHLESWPKYDAALLQKDEVCLAVQINGKLRGEFMWSTERLNEKETIIEHAKGLESINKWLIGQTVQKAIYVPGKIVNLVV
jgi:leucyl-tRNA synthetase